MSYRDILDRIICEDLVDYETTAEQVAAAQKVCDAVKAKAATMPIRIELRPDIRYGTCHGIMVTDLYADEPGNGAGTELMNYLFDLADKAGFNVGLNAEGPRSSRFYQKLGMVKDSSHYHHLVKYPSFDYDEYMNESVDTSPTKYYHVTFNSRVPKIMADGIVTGKKRNWNNGFGEKYGDTKYCYVFTSPASAVHWAHRMEWEFKKPCSIVVLDSIPHAVEDDPSLEQNLVGRGGTWKRVPGVIPPECIERVVPMKPELARAYIQARDHGNGEITI